MTRPLQSDPSPDGGGEHLLAVLLRLLQQLSVIDIGPAPVGCRIHRMTGAMPPKRDGGPLIEKKLHRSTEAFSVFALYSRTSLT